MNFPILYISNNLKSCNTELPPLPEKPIEPKKNSEEKYKLYKPIKKSPPTEDGLKELFIGGVLAFFMFLLIMFIDSSAIKLVPLFIGGIFLLSAVISGIDKLNSYYSYNQYEEDKIYNLAILTYEQRVETMKQLRKEEEETYHNLYNKYLDDCEKYEQELKTAKDPKIIFLYRRIKAAEVLKKVFPPQPYIAEKKASKGASEDVFFMYLYNILGDKIIRGFTISYYKDYLPDIIFYDKNTGLCIDIEIDEPYIGSTGKPIHYKNNATDQYRNDKFIAQGWIVIRFAEEQVVKYPQECCEFIVLTIERLTKKIINANNLNYTKINKPLPEINQWTYEEAEKMYSNKYRNTYLGDVHWEKVKIEKNERADKEKIYIEEIGIFINEDEADDFFGTKSSISGDPNACE